MLLPGPFDQPFSALLLASTLYLLLIRHSHCQCPPILPPCVCSPSLYEPVNLVCDGLSNWQELRAAIAPAAGTRIDGLTILNTPIPVLEASSLQDFAITRLSINRCQLTQIDSRAFDGLANESVTDLDLKDNYLGFIPQSGVTTLKALRKLSLSGNRISTVPARAFDGYSSRRILEKLDLSNNQLSELGQTSLAGLSSLREINLGKNRFTFIPTTALREQRTILENLNMGLNLIPELSLNSLDLPHLKSLSLEFNKLSSISPEAFRGCPNLLFLFVGGNNFRQWSPEMFRNIAQLKILGIGATNIQTIPANAFQYIPNLEVLQMQEAAVSNIESGAFQRIRSVKVIVLSRNQLTQIRQDMFQGLDQLYSLDLKANRLASVDNGAWANLRSLRHLDISTNQLEFLLPNTFDNSLIPTGDRRSLFIQENPWVCDVRIDWFRSWLRNNLDMTIDTSMSRAVCAGPDFLTNWLLIEPDPPRQSPATPSPLEPQFEQQIWRGGSSYIWWILAIILAILLTSILLLAFVRYFISRRRRRDKDIEDEQRIMESTSVVTSAYNRSQAATPYPPGSVIDLDLPPATPYDMATARPNYYD